LIETITVNNLPDEFSAVYDTKSMVNTMMNRFKSIDENNTEYIAELEYTKINGFMPKMMSVLMPGMFKKQTQKWLNQFKTFAEKTESN